jgi:inner membrane protein
VYRSGHYGVGLLAYAPFLYLLAADGRVTWAAAGLAGVYLLTTLPDVDHRLPLVEHRGVTHTLAFALAVGGACAAIGWVLPLPGVDRVTVAAGLGGVGVLAILAHLLADALTYAGVPLLWPLTGRSFSFSLTTADSRLWNGGLFALGVFATAAAVLLASPVLDPQLF